MKSLIDYDDLYEDHELAAYEQGKREGYQKGQTSMVILLVLFAFIFDHLLELKLINKIIDLF